MNFKLTKKQLNGLIIGFSFFLSAPFCLSQEGYSSAAMGMGKMNAQSGLIPAPNQVVVEEFFNYHKHQLTYPKNKDAVALDISRFVTPENELVLQVGICTDTISNLSEIPPVNICLVIDRSGSMNGDRIEKTKDAAIELVKRMREKDLFSLVVFDDRIDVLIPSNYLKKEQAIDVIRSIETRGSTDLNGGILEGYSQVMKKYKSGQNNKVIVLTDAITNTGVVDPIQLVQGTNRYKSEHQIDITMVGVGVDFNNDLSRNITNSNRSSIFFVNDAADIKKVFIDEIESLLAPIGRDVQLEITLASDLKIDKCFGYSPSIIDNKITLSLENMNCGLTQVFLFKVKPRLGAVWKDEPQIIRAELVYRDVENDEQKIVTASENIAKSKFENEADVKKNYCIARIAQCIKDIAVLSEKEDYQEAKYRANYMLESTRKYYPKINDQDIERVYDLLTKYNEILQERSPDQAASVGFPY